MTLQNPDIESFEFTVNDDMQGLRLDRFLAQSITDISRTRLKQVITNGDVRLVDAKSSHLSSPLSSLSGKTINDPSYRVKCCDRIFFTLPVITEPDPEAQEIPLEVIFEDDQVIVINKAAGMVVHPAPGNPDGTLVNALLYHCGDSLSGIGGVRRPGIVHRIDKDTSGLMIVAKTDLAHQRLARQFARHSLERAYQAVVWGVPNPATGIIEGKIGRDCRNRLKMAVVADESRRGRDAITHYRVMRRLEPKRQTFHKTGAVKGLPPSLSLVECRLETGRTHQVRVHMCHIRHPLVGDRHYGKSGNARSKNFTPRARQTLADFKRQALHACLIGFDHPVTGAHLKFETNPPNDMKCLILALEDK